MVQALRKHSEVGVIWAVALFVATATSALADEFPVGCIFHKAGASQRGLDDVQFISGKRLSFVMIHDKDGKPTRCLYSIKTTPFTITCGGRAPEPFSFVGPTPDAQSHDILVFRSATWYKVCYKPV